MNERDKKGIMIFKKRKKKKRKERKESNFHLERNEFSGVRNS